MVYSKVECDNCSHKWLSDRSPALSVRDAKCGECNSTEAKLLGVVEEDAEHEVGLEDVRG